MSNMMLFNEPFADLERLFAARHGPAATTTTAPVSESESAPADTHPAQGPAAVDARQKHRTKYTKYTVNPR